MRSDAREQIFTNSSTTWTYVGDIVIVAHRKGPLSEHDFNQFSASLEARNGIAGIVIVAHDAPPGPAQRALIQKWFVRTKARGAVLTDSLLARGGVTALSWFGVPIAAFSRAHFDAALDFVRIGAEHRTQAHALLTRFERELR